MKKISFLAVLIICINFFAGCSYADTASFANCVSLYNKYVEEVISKEEDIFNDQNCYDIVVSESENNNLAIYINNESIQKNNNRDDYAVLQWDPTNTNIAREGELTLLLNSAMNYFYTYKNVLTDNSNISQKYNTALYNALDKLKDKTNDLIAKKVKLENFFGITGSVYNVDETVTKKAFNNYVLSYFELINQAIEVSKTVENLVNSLDDYKIKIVEQGTSDIACVKGVSLSTELRMASIINNYYYQYFMQKVYGNRDTVMKFENKSMFSDMILLNKINKDIKGDSTFFDSYTIPADKINYLVQNFEVIKTEAENLTQSVSKIGGKTLESTDEDYSYYKLWAETPNNVNLFNYFNVAMSLYSSVSEYSSQIVNMVNSQAF